jgi:hypothetical protein
MLAHGGLDLLRYFYNGILSFSSADTALWFARDLLAGAVVVLLFSVVRPQNSAKIVLVDRRGTHCFVRGDDPAR